jgi:hypothetical protein
VFVVCDVFWWVMSVGLLVCVLCTHRAYIPVLWRGWGNDKIKQWIFFYRMLFFNQCIQFAIWLHKIQGVHKRMVRYQYIFTFETAPLFCVCPVLLEDVHAPTLLTGFYQCHSFIVSYDRVCYLVLELREYSLEENHENPQSLYRSSLKSTVLPNPFTLCSFAY